jgi:hypothetical protein
MKTARTHAGYTMIEIALAIAVIGFALVAIVGVLPSGMQVQKDNREDTIINQDGVFWLEAIRSGATGSVALSSFVDYVVDSAGHTNQVGEGKPIQHTHQILGLLSAPRFSPGTPAPAAQVRAIAGPAVMRDNKDVNFKYVLHSTVFPNEQNHNLFEIRLSFYWPVRPDGTVPNQPKKVLRTMSAGACRISM